MAKLATWKKALIGVVAAAFFFTAVIYSVLEAQQWHCEVCITFKRGTKCRKAAGATEAEAARTAANTACAMLASGMTERINCPNTPPTRKQCRQR